MAYNGHKNYNAWNIALWLGNNESLYHLARWCIRTSDNRNQAARKMMEHLPEKTPDGVVYTVTNVRLAIAYL